jgi:glycosyltransferase involved in cell wall biosynthesis
VKTSRSDKRIHIMQVTFGMSIGGMERVIMELCRYVDPSRYKLSICCISKRGPLADIMEDEGVPVYFCENQSKMGKYLRGFELARVFADQKVDLLHTHHMPAFIDSTLGAQLARVPILINTDHCKRYPIERRWQVLEKGASRFADSIVAVSQHTRNDLIQYQRIAPEKIQVIYNGIDIKLRRRDNAADIRHELGLQPDDIVFGTVARLEEQKGLDLLIDAAPLVLKRMPNARFLIVGGGSLEEDLRQRAAALGLERQVIVTGYRTDAVDLMQTFDCFVQTSLFEGMPMALLEAMALNKPIVATAVGGVPEVVEDGVCATLLSSRDPQDLTDALVNVAGDPVVRQRIGDAGRQRYEHNFTAAAMVSQYEQLYEHCLARKRVRVH